MRSNFLLSLASAALLASQALFAPTALAQSPAEEPQGSQTEDAAAVPAPYLKTVTLLFTNDVESVYDPIDAFWLDDIGMIGGVAQLSTLITQLREREPNVFLFDSGDIFTGALAKLTEGELSFELMTTMGYDAMAIGNHEFEFGEEVIAWQKNRAAFPVLAANLFYKGTDHPFSQAHAVIERDGIRIGVIGIMGQDAATAIIPSFIDELDVIDPATAVRRSVEELRDDVDLIVLLTHQGKTAPMQTDAESDPRLQRGIAADIALAGAVEGIDVLLGGHTDAGTPEAVVHPETGTLIMQTYGQGTHLGFLQILLNHETGEVLGHTGRLIPVDADTLAPDPAIIDKLTQYRVQHQDLFVEVGRTTAGLNRRYIEESDIGNLFADIFAEVSGADVGMVHAGSLRKDIPAGPIQRVDLLDAYPFVDPIVKIRVTGKQLRAILEQSLTLERGLLQVSGRLTISYDLGRPVRDRLVSMQLDGRDVADDDTLTVAVAGFLAEGGDLFETFPQGETLEAYGKVSDEIIGYFERSNAITPPQRGRQIELGR